MKIRFKEFQIIILLVLSVFLISSCAKKVVKEEGEIKEPSVTEETTPSEGQPEMGMGEEKIGEENLGSPVTEGKIREEEMQPGAGGLAEEGGRFEEGRRAEIRKEVSAMAEEEGKLLPIYFDFDRYSIRDDATEILKGNARWLKDHPDARIQIEGHADERGSNEYNLALGDRRARSTMTFLRDLGVTNPLSTISYGEEKPVCTESNESCWSRNRRAEFKIISR